MIVQKEVTKPLYDALSPEIERELVLALCCDQQVFSALGRAVDAERLNSRAHKTLVIAAKAVESRTGVGPIAFDQVIQEVHSLYAAGSKTFDELSECREVLGSGRTLGTDEVISSVAPVLQRDAHTAAAKQATVDYQNKVDPAETARRFEEVGKIGKLKNRDTVSADVALLDPKMFEPRKDSGLFRLGIDELDSQLDGIEKHSLTLFMGATGAGKSISLAHVAAEALFCGHDVYYVTLELGRMVSLKRVYKNLTHMTGSEMSLDGGAEMRRRWALLKGEGMGTLYCAFMDAHMTSPADIKAEVKAQRRLDRKWSPTVFVVDFVDKVRASAKASLYEDQAVVVDGLRSLAVDNDGWTFTASQTRREKGNNAWPDVNDIADSMNKVRSADVVIGIGRTDDDEANKQVRFSVPKRREGEGAHSRVGPLDFDPEHGRMVTGQRKNPW